jgi:hypothetical protein
MKIHKETDVRNRKHTVKTDAHKKGHLKISVHKSGGRKRKGSKKTILK